MFDANRQTLPQLIMNQQIFAYKCHHHDCNYGPSGAKFFKKSIFLQNHLKNVHEEKKYFCQMCQTRFALDWQLRYHAKFCGIDLTCATCGKTYNKPMSLWMHCKRHSHFPSSTSQLKPKLQQKNLKPTYVFIPVAISSNYPVESLPMLASYPITPSTSGNSSIKRKPILPKFDQCIRNDCESSSQKIKRSTDCQTVRKRNRANGQQDSKSIQTQTLHSSFDVGSGRQSPEDNLSGINNTKCSSFTQTHAIVDMSKDPFLSKSCEVNTVDGRVSQLSNYYNYNTIETQTNTSFEISNICDPSDASDFNQFADLEVIDIETQTIWNYDRTTQTDSPITLDDYYSLNL